MTTRRTLSSFAAFALLAACADDFGGTLTPAEALRRQQEAGSARATTLMCTSGPTFTQTATGTECSLADVNTCVARITAAANCEGINAAYVGCPVRCR